MHKSKRDFFEPKIKYKLVLKSKIIIDTENIINLQRLELSIKKT
jgi:hypothetical protein